MRMVLIGTDGKYHGYYIMGKPIPLGQFAVVVSSEDAVRLGVGSGYWSLINQCVVADNTDGRAQLEMTAAHEEHLSAIKDWFLQEVDQKYRAGVNQHGGKLWTKPGIIDKALEEALDNCVFLYTLKMQLENPNMVDPDARDIDG